MAGRQAGRQTQGLSSHQLYGTTHGMALRQPSAGFHRAEADICKEHGAQAQRTLLGGRVEARSNSGELGSSPGNSEAGMFCRYW